jgi:hypothetical protein
MDSAKLNDWMQAAGIFAVVASLVFVGLQIQQDRAISTVESLSSRADILAELANMIGTNRALWVSGLNGDELSEEDMAAFQAMAEAVESYFVSVYIRLNAIDGSQSGGPRSGEEPIRNYAFALYLHRGLRRIWKMQLDYWRARDLAFDIADGGAEFRNRVDETLTQLEKDAPPIPNEKRYVFW